MLNSFRGFNNIFEFFVFCIVISGGCENFSFIPCGAGIFKDFRAHGSVGNTAVPYQLDKCISRYCNYAALVIILVALASYVVGRGDVFFGQFGIMVSIALLAIAAINDPARK